MTKGWSITFCAGPDALTPNNTRAVNSFPKNKRLSKTSPLSWLNCDYVLRTYLASIKIGLRTISIQRILLVNPGVTAIACLNNHARKW